MEELKKNLADNDIYRVPEWLCEVLAMAKENGRKEALKDLPRWKKGDIPKGELAVTRVGIYQRGYGVIRSDGNNDKEGSLPIRRYILISDLEKLPAED